ncbi:MAG TPA: ATP cone domain-containing protein [Terriglobales bacterium]|nr:ATP cone domain-containing protein [Terriglobales bacterium]
MREKQILNIYLAGPVTNCNERQKTEWRKRIKGNLANLGHRWIDPAEHQTWTPFKEMVEIDRSDVVIANLWKESVGTVIGIVQARSKGKPVILVDPNYLDNVVLRHLVGKDYIVHGIDEATNLLTQIVEQLNKTVMVRKGSGAEQPFSATKLHVALNAVCARAHIEDALLPDLVANAVHRKVLKSARNGEIQSEQIKLLVFDTLGEIATDNLYEQELKHRAVVFRDAWQEHERVKKDQKWALQYIDELEHKLDAVGFETESLKTQIVSLTSENKDLRRSIRASERQTQAGRSATIASEAEIAELRKDFLNYFPSLLFTDAALGWLLSCDKVARRSIESKFRLMTQSQIDGKHEVPGTDPLVWQHDAGHGLRIYYRQKSNDKTAVLRIGTKGTQESDYSKLKKQAKAAVTA